MITISLCMIVRNEEKSLAQCLRSIVAAVDEIIIVDTGSCDRTKEIARTFTDQVFDFKWIDDFAAARNFAYAQASKDYILWLDADDVVAEEERRKIITLKKTLPGDVDAVRMKYNIDFDENGNVLFSYYRERLSRRAAGFRWQEPVHEFLAVSGNVINTDICITHTKKEQSLSRRNLDIYEGVLAQGKTLSARGMYYYARELKTHGRYAEAVRVLTEFLDSGRGWLEDNIGACGELAHCYLSLNEEEKALAAMLRSFQFDKPRAELCCQIGYYFKKRGNFALAAFWFELILSLEKPKDSLGFIQNDCWGYIPCLECAICYDRLGDPLSAEHFNMRAGGFKPDSEAVAHNKKYFAAKNKKA